MVKRRVLDAEGVDGMENWKAYPHPMPGRIGGLKSIMSCTTGVVRGWVTHQRGYADDSESQDIIYAAIIWALLLDKLVLVQCL